MSKSLSLFYPSSGDDLIVPVRRCARSVDDFFFVDQGYQPERPLHLPGYRMVDERHHVFEGHTLRTRHPYRVTVYRRTLEGVSGRIHVHLCAGRVYDAFRSIYDAAGYTLGVFFYRGDSPGEGGGGFRWLGECMLPHVPRRLAQGGLIMTDGSNAIDPLAHFRRRDMVSEEAADAAEAFTYRGCRFTCDGAAGRRYGPTLVWRVNPEIQFEAADA